MGLARVAAGALAVVCAVGLSPIARADGRASSSSGSAGGSARAAIGVVADRDDDDGDGTPDGEQAFLPPPARADLVPFARPVSGAHVRATRGGDRLRLVVDGRPVPWDAALRGEAMLQGLAAGTATLVVARAGAEETIDVLVRGVELRGGDLAFVDMTRSHASVERTPPARPEGDVDAPYDDPDALRVVLESDVPRDVSVESLGASGARIDVLGHVALEPSACGRALPCFATAPIRFAMDEVDRIHPLVRARSIRAEVGGAIAVWLDGRKAQQLRVLGPRKTTAGPIEALAPRLRPFVVRVVPGGAPAIGGTDAVAVDSVRAELAAASAIWGQCGVTFGDTRTQDVRIVDPPPPYLIAVGDGLGLLASGGQMDLRIDGKTLYLPVLAGSSADRVANELARAVERAGFVATVSPNARIAPGVAGSVDVLVRHKDGTFAVVDAPSAVASRAASITSDETLTVRIGSVDLSDGLQHFTDTDAMAGTLEERTLLKSVDDGDPSTIEIVVVPMFAGGGRIGESFIGSDLSSLRNVVLLDRAGIRARRSSLTLAHELGHVLMDMPGHPDDYGVDTPTMLMDSDASDASPFGPRRLTLDECARVVKQSGVAARVPMLSQVRVRPLVVASPRPPLEEAP